MTVKLDPATAATPATRPIPRKLSLRVSGARAGSAVRPVVPGAPPSPPATPRLGLRVHGSSLGAPAPLSPDDYATAEDYE